MSVEDIIGDRPLPERVNFDPFGDEQDRPRKQTSFDDRQEPPPADGPDDFGLGEQAPAQQAPKITARPYEFRDPKSIPMRDRLYGTHLYRGFTSATIAPGGYGKTTLHVAETLAQITARPLLKVHVADRPLRVWYWNLEDPFEELERRFQAACLYYQISAEDIAGRLYVNGSEDTLLIARQTPNGTKILEPVVDNLIAEIQARQIDILTIDPFVSSHAVSENDNSSMDAVSKTWNRVAAGGNCAVHLAHHSRKLGPDAEVTAESARGASASVAAWRNVRVLNRMTETQAGRAEVENCRLYFRTYSDKSNLAPPSDVSDWYKLASVDLENGPPGASDLVAVATRWTWPDELEGMSARDLFAVQKRIAEGEWRESSQSAKWAGRAVAEVLDLDPDSGKARITAMLKTWIRTGALKVERREDEHRKERDFVIVGQLVTP